MALNCGIVGLPNVGKTTIFQALSGTKAETANYAFSTRDPNVGIIAVPDERLTKLAEIFKPKRVIPATVEFVDIAGLVKGASKGEGLGNRFLSHIREVGMTAHVVRCFDDPNVVHVNDRIDPVFDMETIAIELALADFETLQRGRERGEKMMKVKTEQKQAATLLGALDKIAPALEEGKPVRSLPLSDDEKAAIYDCHFITAKPELYVCNVDEDGMRAETSGASIPWVQAVREHARAEGSEAVVICGKFEAELGDIADPDERLAFMEELGLRESALSALIHGAYGLLGLRTFFTAGEDECRAWTIHAGDLAPKAAGVIHTDFEKGFIKAEAYSFSDLLACGSEAKVKEAGKYRIEGREYQVKDGDVLFFKFNV